MDYTIKPSNAKFFLTKTLNAGLVPFLHGSPGMGKSDIIKSIAEDFNLQLIDLRLSQCDPSDLLGMPFRDGDKSSYKPFDTFPLVGDKIPEGKDGWLLFLDEANGASKAVQLASYKILLDKMVGNYHIHPNVAMIAAGNLATDKAVVNTMSTATQSRLVHYMMEPDHEDWINWAIPNGIDSRIIGYLSFRTAHFHNFDPNHQDKTFACPRTWEMLSKQIKEEPTVDVTLAPLVTGTVGNGVGTEFLTFCENYLKIPKLEDIVKNPEKIDIPSESSTKYAITTFLLDKVDEKIADPLCIYMDRFDIEFKVLFLQSVFKHKREVAVLKCFRSRAQEVTKYINSN